MSGARHGTRAGWIRHRRANETPCVDCAEALRRYQRERYASAKALPKIKAGDGDQRHGTANGYKNLGCRCDDCVRAHTAGCAPYVVAHRARKTGRAARSRPEGGET